MFLSKFFFPNRKLLQKHLDGMLFSIFDMQINYMTHFTTLKVKSLSQRYIYIYMSKQPISLKVFQSNFFDNVVFKQKH